METLATRFEKGVEFPVSKKLKTVPPVTIQGNMLIHQKLDAIKHSN